MVRLRAMTAAEFEAFAAQAVADYAREQVASGAWSQIEAGRQSAEAFAGLLPQGCATPDHSLWSIVDKAHDEPLGSLWVQVRQRGSRRVAHVLSVQVAAPFRRRGVARAALLALEEQARAAGLAAITLHVFGHNSAARALYAGLGFQVTDLDLAKVLIPSNAD